jgi:hypothetical protein
MKTKGIYRLTVNPFLFTWQYFYRYFTAFGISSSRFFLCQMNPITSSGRVLPTFFHLADTTHCAGAGTITRAQSAAPSDHEGWAHKWMRLDRDLAVNAESGDASNPDVSI